MTPLIEMLIGLIFGLGSFQTFGILVRSFFVKTPQKCSFKISVFEPPSMITDPLIFHVSWKALQLFFDTNRVSSLPLHFSSYDMQCSRWKEQYHDPWYQVKSLHTQRYLDYKRIRGLKYCYSFRFILLARIRVDEDHSCLSYPEVFRMQQNAKNFLSNLCRGIKISCNYRI